jgi:NTE family protein
VSNRVTSGDLAQALRASIAIPGALPPVVHDGDLLCDGGTFNNFPVDVMRDCAASARCSGSTWAHACRASSSSTRSRAAGLCCAIASGRGQAALPVAVADGVPAQRHDSLQHVAQQEARRLTDVYFSPPLHRIGLLQWSRFDADRAPGPRACSRSAGRTGTAAGRARYCAKTWLIDALRGLECR